MALATTLHLEELWAAPAHKLNSESPVTVHCIYSFVLSPNEREQRKRPTRTADGCTTGGYHER